MAAEGNNTILRIWTHNLRGVEYIDDFKPTSCPFDGTLQAARASAGAVGGDVQSEVAKYGAAVTTGGNPVGFLPRYPLSLTRHGPNISRIPVSSAGLLVEAMASSPALTEWARITSWKPLL